MADTKIPTRSNQPGADSGLEISPDGNPIAQMAAPIGKHAPRVEQSANSDTSMERAPTVDESGNEVSTEQTQQVQQSQEEQGTQTAKKEEQEEPVVDFTEFLKTKETGELSDEIQKQKTESEVSAKSKTEEGQTQQAQQVQQKQTLAERKAQDLQSRDLTGLPEDLVPHFQKDMSRAAFDKVKPIVLEHKTLKEQAAQQSAELERLRKGAIPDSYYDNPAGFVLDPEYQKAEMTVNQAQAVLAHWQQQYKAVRDGAAEFTVAAFDRNGNLVPSGKQAADKDAEFQIMQIVNNAQQQLFKFSGKAEAIRENFKSRHTNALGWLKNYEDKAFQVFNTEQGKQFEPQIKSIIAEFPPELRSHPLVKTLAKSIATNVHLATLLVQNNGKAVATPANGQQQTTKTANGKTSTAAQQQRRAGPTIADTGATSISKEGDGKAEVSYDDFNKAKEETY